MHFSIRVVFVSTVVLSSLTVAYGEDAEPISPTSAVIPLFNGKNLDGLYTWLQDTQYEDPRKVFTVEDGMLHISGDAGGYICTKQRYKDYHLVVEYRWGDRTWQSRKTSAKDTGVIVHCTDPDWSDTLGYRGKQDVESPGQEWTRLDVICDGGHIVYRVNDILVNEGFDSVPSSGKILIQTEFAEVYVRRFELQPL